MSNVRRWYHRKRDSEYTEQARGQLQSSGGPIPEGAQLVAYRDVVGVWWFRPEPEFEDGRFKELPSAPSDVAAAEVRGIAKGLQEAALLVEFNITQLIAGKRPNQIDRHVYEILKDQAAAIRALIPLVNKAPPVQS